MEILCLVLFLALVVTWAIMPTSSKTAAEGGYELSSIGDEVGAAKTAV